MFAFVFIGPSEYFNLELDCSRPSDTGDGARKKKRNKKKKKQKKEKTLNDKGGKSKGVETCGFLSPVFSLSRARNFRRACNRLLSNGF